MTTASTDVSSAHAIMSDKQSQDKSAKPVIQANKPSKTIFQTESPFSATEWPILDKKTNGAMTDLLRDILEPIGHHRATNLKQSRAKKQLKRKRKRSKSLDRPQPTIPEADSSDSNLPPQILSSTLIGYNTVIRHLQHLTQQPTQKSSPEEAESPSTEPPTALPVIFVTGNPSWPPYAQLPLLSALASQESNISSRLVLLDPKSEEVLAKALGVGRVGVIGLLEGVEEVSGGKGLIELVRGSVDVTSVPWKDELERVSRGEWLGSSVGVVARLDHPKER